MLLILFGCIYKLKVALFIEKSIHYAHLRPLMFGSHSSSTKQTWLLLKVKYVVRFVNLFSLLYHVISQTGAI